MVCVLEEKRANEDKTPQTSRVLDVRWSWTLSRNLHGIFTASKSRTMVIKVNEITSQSTLNDEVCYLPALRHDDREY